MADTSQAIADIFGALSPLDDPEQAAQNPQAAIQALNSDKAATPAQPSWLDSVRSAQTQQAAQPTQDTQPVEEAQNVTPPSPQQQRDGVPPAPGLSPNGNMLPPGLKSRVPAATPAQAVAAPTQAGGSPQGGTAPAVPGSVTPSGDPSTLASTNTATIHRMQSDYEKASGDVDAESAQPSLADQTAKLEQQRANYAQPIDPRAVSPLTGKPLYKPTLGQQVVRGLRAFGSGGLTGPANYSAPNKDYGYDEAQRQGRIANVDQQLKNAADNYKATSERLQKVAADRRALATSGKDVTGAATQQEQIPIDQQKADADTQNSKNNSPQGKGAAVQAEIDARKTEGTALGLRGPALDRYSLGQNPIEQFAPNAELVSRAQAMTAWKNDPKNKGKQPTLDDIRDIDAAASGSEIKGSGGGKPIPPALQNKILDEKKSSIDQASSFLRDGEDKDHQPYTKQDYVRDVQSAQDKFESAVEENGGTVDHMTVNPDLSWTTAPKAAPVSAAAPPITSSSKLSADGSWQGMAPKQAGEIAVIAPDGTPGYATPAWLKKNASKGYKKAGAN